jgi:5-methylthioadenosine/S-adenosylhomocysteine deaminase
VASNNTVDLFEEVRFALLFARTGDIPLFIDAAGAIRLMTLGGAQALGLESEIGSLEPGKRADIIAVSLSAVSQRPINDVESSIVFSSGARDVILTMVDGEEIYRGGRILTVDESEILKSIN